MTPRNLQRDPVPILNRIYKGSGEVYPIGLRYGPPDLDRLHGETISAAVVTVVPAGLVLTGDPIINLNEVSQIIEGGVTGIEYTVQFKVITSTGKIFCHPYIDVIKVKIN
jgi:hypothetical protein